MLPLPEHAQLMLESHIVEGGHPTFLATVQGRRARIELRSSALLALAKRPGANALSTLLDERREAIRLAAQRLYNEGFFTETENGIEIDLTAIDL